MLTVLSGCINELGLVGVRFPLQVITFKRVHTCILYTVTLKCAKKDDDTKDDGWLITNDCKSLCVWIKTPVSECVVYFFLCAVPSVFRINI